MSLGCGLSRKNLGLIFAFVGQKNGAIACSKKGCLLTGSGDSDGAGMGSQGTVVEFGEFANAATNARTDGEGPEDAALAELNISGAASGLKILDVVWRGSRKEKKFVEVTLPRQFGLTGRQIRILGQLARRERAQRDNGHASLGSEGLQSFRSCGLLLGDRQAGERSQPHSRGVGRPGSGGLRPQVEIAFGKEYSGAILGDKRVGVRQFAAGCIHLKAGAAGWPDCRGGTMRAGG